MNKHQMDFLNILLSHLDESEVRVNCIDLKIEEALESFRTQLNKIDGIPGINIVAAASIIAEIGVEMKHFKTSDHICSWAGLAPGNNESAGKKKAHE
jgi:transposase